MHNEFETVTLAPGAEFSGWCQSWVLNNSEEIWVNSVTLETDGGYHHSNWFFVPEGQHDYPDGLWKKCYSTGFSEVEAADSGGVLFAQSTQVVSEVQAFPPGVAVRIPPYSRIIGATHVLNYHAEPLTTGLRMTLQPIRESEVQVKMTPFRLSYLDLNIPAGAKADFTGDCEFRSTYEAVADTALDMQIYYLLPHYHALGDGFSLDIIGGPDDGKRIFELGTFSPEPFGLGFDQPVDLSEAQGLRFTCSYHNTLKKKVSWGIGDDEMCVLLGFADARLALDMSVIETTETVSEDGRLKSTGPCIIFPVPFDQNKPGGTPP